MAISASSLTRWRRTALRLPRGGGQTNLRVLLRGLILPLLLLLLWELGSRAGLLPPNKYSSPSAVFREMWDLAASGELAGHILITLYRVFVGFVAGTAAATVLGSLTGYSKVIRELLDPTIQALRNVPSIAWVPLFIVWLGIYETSKITLIAVGVFFPVYLNLMSGIQNVDRKLVEVGRMYRLSGFRLVQRVLLPATLPSYLVGLRSGLGLGWMFVVASELMGASRGLGYLLIDGQMTGRVQVVIGSIVLFAILGKLTDLALARLSQRFAGWQDSYKNTEIGDGDAAR
jgi:sulfonate transport system permease protein